MSKFLFLQLSMHFHSALATFEPQNHVVLEPFGPSTGQRASCLKNQWGSFDDVCKYLLTNRDGCQMITHDDLIARN